MNIVFSSLLKKESKIRNKLFEKELEIFAPNFLFIEFIKNINRIISYSELKEDELIIMLEELFEHINFVPDKAISKENKVIAYQLFKDVDVKDTPYIALALELNCLLWTGDKKLKQGLFKKNINIFYEINQ
ncbi:MAG TPA: PIN domain-containing protein [Candidatus Kapabacteria bacterium]|nr:PIN domain-containing protein [Candidatus Kapabacteria bacterium]